MAKDWTHLFEKYCGKWVALADDETTVVASGATAKKRTVLLSNTRASRSSIACRTRSTLSSAMKFKYPRYRRNDGPDITRPIIPVLIHNPRDPLSSAIAHEALVDSGADFCVFSSGVNNHGRHDLYPLLHRTIPSGAHTRARLYSTRANTRR